MNDIVIRIGDDLSHMNGASLPGMHQMRIVQAQRMEITEHMIYKSLGERDSNGKNAPVLLKIAGEELRHYTALKSYTGEEVAPDRLRMLWYLLLSRLFGLTFAIKLMEKSEGNAKETYAQVSTQFPELAPLIREEEAHERALVGMIDEERLKYMGSVVLGLNDALVELTGTLAGLSFALQETKLIALAGLITGISAALSMAASEYLSRRAEGGGREPGKAALYTGSTYILTVILLISPFFVFDLYTISLGTTLLVSIAVIAIFNFYLSVTRDLLFGRRFIEMAGISLGIAMLSFVLGALIRTALHIEV
ncbi:MAG: VIT1/CCC1 transporter family protein [Methanomicrobiales archaeon]|nr:VIT1/CCC1 transporter family protein [Methanomicrobiales archaeon]